MDTPDLYPNVPEWQRDIVRRRGDMLDTAGYDPLELLNAAQTAVSEPDGPAADAPDVGSPERARDAMLRNIGAGVLAQVELLRRLEDPLDHGITEGEQSVIEDAE